MNCRYFALAFAVALGAAPLLAANTATSSPAFVFLKPETTQLWTTGQGSRMSVTIPYPAGARTATLKVAGYRYSAEYANITTPDFLLELPAAVSPETENVYSLELTFDNGDVLTARLGGIAGYDATNEGATRCLANVSERKWAGVKGSAVLPVPYGAETISIGGVPTPTGFGGAAGWYMLAPVEPGQTVSLALDGQEPVDVFGRSIGLSLVIR